MLDIKKMTLLSYVRYKANEITDTEINQVNLVANSIELHPKNIKMEHPQIKSMK